MITRKGLDDWKEKDWMIARKGLDDFFHSTNRINQSIYLLLNILWNCET